MTGALILLILGGFFMGGGIAFFRQQKPFLGVLLLLAIAFGCVILGATLARNSV
ncbi:MAG TPA: hypothetical protein VFR22_16870 [Nocardioidaceae bacterium]|nr:hypothetical protein [Nocardioidaceae bacterium]